MILIPESGRSVAKSQGHLGNAGKDNKHGRTISTVSNAQVEITSLAARFNSKESIKELPFAAAGAFTSQTRS